MIYLFYGLIVICSGYIGLSISKSFEIKYRLFNDLVNFIEKLKIDIGFFQNTINEIINNYKYSSTLSPILKNYLLYIKSNEKNKLGNFIKIDYISEDEKNSICEFLLSIGNSDSVSQVEMLNNYKIVFSEYCRNHKTNFDKYGKTSFKLSIVVGLFFVILLI